jgi:hypothetical protein
MRMNNQHLPAVAAAPPLPFAGLGFTTTEVRQAARGMTPAVHGPIAGTAVFTAGCGPSAQSGGYRLLVALSREIRGR